MKKYADMPWDLNPEGVMRTNQNNFQNMKDLLDSKGQGFCLAKWNQVTMHLGTGMTHSCHHPTIHKIPHEEILKNKTALHNTEFKKQQRKDMLAGKKPAECDYCWRVEDANNGEFSDRVFKSLEPWALKDHDVIQQMNGDEDVLPTYLEVSFSNVCNMKCTYCGPEASSKWYEDVKQNGPIKLLSGHKDEHWAQGWQKDLEVFKHKDDNPYVNAFWEWWPELYKNLKVFRITGGEPLMSKDTFKVLDWFLENSNPDLELSINSNLSVPDKLWDKFVYYLEQLKDSDKIKSVTIYTSIEGWGKRAEYGRTGLNFKLFKQRYEQLVSMGNVRCVIMATYNIFSVTSFEYLLEWQKELRLKHNTNKPMMAIEEAGFGGSNFANVGPDKNWKHDAVVCLDTPYLRHPSFLDARICTHDLVDYMLSSLDYMSANLSEVHWTQHQGFESHEIDKFRRIVFHRIYWNKNDNDRPDWQNRQDIDILRAKFYEFIIETDKRNNTDFVSTFPEMEHFWNECVAAHGRVLGNGSAD